MTVMSIRKLYMSRLLICVMALTSSVNSVISMQVQAPIPITGIGLSQENKKCFCDSVRNLFCEELEHTLPTLNKDWANSFLSRKFIDDAREDIGCFSLINVISKQWSECLLSDMHAGIFFKALEHSIATRRDLIKTLLGAGQCDSLDHYLMKLYSYDEWDRLFKRCLEECIKITESKKPLNITDLERYLFKRVSDTSIVSDTNNYRENMLHCVLGTSDTELVSYIKDEYQNLSDYELCRRGYKSLYIALLANIKSKASFVDTRYWGEIVATEDEKMEAIAENKYKEAVRQLVCAARSGSSMLFDCVMSVWNITFSDLEKSELTDLLSVVIDGGSCELFDSLTQFMGKGSNSWIEQFSEIEQRELISGAIYGGNPDLVSRLLKLLPLTLSPSSLLDNQGLYGWQHGRYALIDTASRSGSPEIVTLVQNYVGLPERE